MIEEEITTHDFPPAGGSGRKRKESADEMNQTSFVSINGYSESDFTAHIKQEIDDPYSGDDDPLEIAEEFKDPGEFVQVQIKEEIATEKTKLSAEPEDETGKHKRVCKTCLELYPMIGKGSWSVHKSECLGRLLFNCKICNQAYGSKETIWKHLDEHKVKKTSKSSSFGNSRMKEQIYRCEKCDDGRVFRKAAYWVHMKDTHHITLNQIVSTKGGMNCLRCSEVFPTIQRLNYHVITVHEQPKFCCQHCPKRFHIKSFFKRHMQLHENPKGGKFRCKSCAVSFSTRSSLTMHRNANHPSDEQGLTCVNCSKAFSSQQDLDHHMITVHERPKLCCPHCPKEFLLRSTYLNHMRSHE